MCFLNLPLQPGERKLGVLANSLASPSTRARARHQHSLFTQKPESGASGPEAKFDVEAVKLNHGRYNSRSG